MTLNGLISADAPLRNYSFTQSSISPKSRRWHRILHDRSPW